MYLIERLDRDAGPHPNREGPRAPGDLISPFPSQITKVKVHKLIAHRYRQIGALRERIIYQ